MRTFILTLALILILSLVFVTGTNQRHSNDALREQLFDYLLEARRQELLYNRRKELEKEIERYRENRYNDDESNSNDDDENDGSNDYKRTHVRRKAVGLGDNPFK